MQVKQIVIRKNQDYESARKILEQLKPQLVILFGAKYFFNNDLVSFYESFKSANETHWLGCSTAGEIYNKGVIDNSLILTAIHFNNVKIHSYEQKIEKATDFQSYGAQLAQHYFDKNINFLFLLARGVNINGTTLLNGIYSKLKNDIVVTGGLAGDSGEFKQTLSFFNGHVSDSSIVSFALERNENIKVGYGSYGGWKPFGPVRKVTKADDNILYELDGESALKVYKKYLGGDAVKLPASGLRYPFSILNENEDQTGIIRSILGINEVEGSLIFAGDISSGQNLRLMHADHVGLIDGATEAAKLSQPHKNEGAESLSLLVSCVGRKIVMGEDVDDEIDAVREIVGEKSTLAGFYSNGEFCPISKFMECKLHNQTMTITQIVENN